MEFSNEKVAIIGAGNMGGMVASLLLQTALFQPNQIVFGWIRKERQQKLQQQFPGCIFAETNAQATQQSTITFITVKPGLFKTISQELVCPNKNTLYISLVAVLKLRTIQSAIRTSNIVRCATTIGIQNGNGTNVWISSRNIDPKQKELAKNILGLLGRNWTAPDERALDKAILISGCMFGLIAYHIQCYTRPVSCNAFPEKMAREIIAHTFQNAAALCLNSELPLNQIIEQVATKGGMTAAMLETLHKNNRGPALIEDVVRTGFTRIKQVKELLKK
ncbi:MAG: pyrroline-5-carboxylate reductase dimerization domain-containing protein [Patescibacteria group bacterium]